MARTPLPEEDASKPLNVKVPPEDLLYVQEVLKPELGVPYNSDVVREVIKQLRTTFGLPDYVVDAIERDRKAKKQNILKYLQELLSRRSEDLRANEARAPEVSKAAKRSRR